jgi:AIPR protein
MRLHPAPPPRGDLPKPREFHLSGLSIVDEAQTVAAIARTAQEAAAEELGARVWVRLISLEGCPPEFATQVTEATNTQNTVERSDFVALDPEQGRLRTDLLLSLQKIYSIKRGEDNRQPEHGCTEATVALACSQPDPALAVRAKSAAGRLWESTTRDPYNRPVQWRDVGVPVVESCSGHSRR